MLPIANGSMIICSYVEDWSHVKDGTPCIVVTRNDGIVFKIVHNRVKQSRTFRLESLNVLYKPYEVAVDEILEVWQFVSYMSNHMPAGETDTAAIMQAIQDVRQEVKALSNASKPQTAKPQD